MPGHVLFLTRNGSQTFYTTWRGFFPGVTLRKTCAMWTLKWGAKSGPRFGVRRIVFCLSRPFPKRGPDFRPHFEVHIACRFFSQVVTLKKVIPE